MKTDAEKRGRRWSKQPQYPLYAPKDAKRQTATNIRAMNLYYTLDKDGNPQPESDVTVWSKFIQSAKKTIAATTIGTVRISTVFLGLDHSFHPDGPPVLWETMIFGGEHDGHQQRYSSLAQAKIGHREACMLVEATSI